ncbi:MAG: IclR family transcriptional regulator [Candidatus Ratteibacteria bacterium]|jgi:IclR family KDG regulon transcriptional repressor
MIQSIERALGILQILAEEPEKPRTLGEIALSLNLNKSTCANLLKTLLILGYVEQPIPRQGYILGPMIFYLARNGPYRKDIITTAQPIITFLANSLSATVLIATLTKGKRDILCQVDGNSVFTVRSDYLLKSDIYITATGRLLLSSLSEKELFSFVQMNGLPHETWPQIRSFEDLKKELSLIFTEKIAIRVGEVAAVAVPIFQGQSMAAALGLFLPLTRFTPKQKPSIISAMQQAAEELTTLFSRKHGGPRET